MAVVGLISRFLCLTLNAVAFIVGLVAILYTTDVLQGLIFRSSGTQTTHRTNLPIHKTIDGLPLEFAGTDTKPGTAPPPNPPEHTGQHESFLKISTSSGTLLGRHISTPEHNPIYEFHNVPYASPPVGDLRFLPPVPHDEKNPWRGEVDGREQRDVRCVQPGDGTVIGQEDCLQMTIRSPDLTTPKPVLVWIHGGRFIHGWCCEPGLNPDSSLTDSLGVVTVNVNYRLGFLGFHAIRELWEEGQEEEGSSKDRVIANNGIRDMIAALEWVRENIGLFGGVPDKVTIMGESAGGTAVLALLASPLTDKLFSAAISLSPGPEQRFNHDQADKFQRSVWRVLEGVGCEREGCKGKGCETEEWESDGCKDEGCQDDDFKGNGYKTEGCDTEDCKCSSVRECLLQVPASHLTAMSKNNPEGKLLPSRLGYFDFPGKQGPEHDIGGYITVDPLVLPTSIRNLKRVKGNKRILVSNLAEETAVHHMKHPEQAIISYEALKETLKRLFKNLTTDPDVLDNLHPLYSHLSPQFYWDTLVTDMKSTCPTNEITAVLAGIPELEVYRLYISYNMKRGKKERVPAYHAFDIKSLFGYKKFVEAEISKEDWKFRDCLIDVLRQFIWNHTEIQSYWGHFPEKSLFLGNKDNLDSSTDIPGELRCAVLRKFNLLKHGWQN